MSVVATLNKSLKVNPNSVTEFTERISFSVSKTSFSLLCSASLALSHMHSLFRVPSASLLLTPPPNCPFTHPHTHMHTITSMHTHGHAHLYTHLNSTIQCCCSPLILFCTHTHLHTQSGSLPGEVCVCFCPRHSTLIYIMPSKRRLFHTANCQGLRGAAAEP